MSKIHLLNNELINKIAAGEVVERPASVVKELVENAVDAEATEIRVELEDGGKGLILVADDGVGIEAEDMKLAVTRHATSKISESDDLFAIDTLGFRGEALASIASVCRFSLQSRRREDESGHKIEVEEEAVRTSPWQGPSGTTVMVRDLFFNIPVRKSFLKKTATEYGQILEYLQAMAMNIPSLGITLLHNGKEQFRVPPMAPASHEYLRGEGPLRERAQLVLGKQKAAKLIYCQRQDKDGHVELLLSPPGEDRPNTKQIYTFVNSRWVKDKTLRYGILRGYHSHILKNRYPLVIAHLSIDPSLVDVNVHPSKTELRFQYASEVQNLLAHAIRESIRKGAWTQPASSPASSSPPLASTLAPYMEQRERPPAIGSASIGIPPKDFDLMGESPRRHNSESSLTSGQLLRPEPRAKMRDMTVTETLRTSRGGQGETKGGGQSGDLLWSAAAPLESKALPSNDGQADGTDGARGRLPFSTMNYVSSILNCYLIFDLKDRILVVDQHAFHERILYERFLADYKNMGESQRLLLPEVLQVSPQDHGVLTDHQAELEALGFELKFSESDIEVLAVPALLKEADFEGLLAELSQSFGTGQSQLGETTFSHTILSTMACHAAVRSGENLGEEDVRQLAREADEIDFYLNCPHGRRVFRFFSRREVGGWFDR